MTWRILLVEDEDDNRNLLIQLLSRYKCQVLTACDGREAITVAQREPPDLILMDLALPALDGWEATKAIKGIPELAHVPIIALTAHAMQRDREKALAVGCDEHIGKPIDIRRFFDQIRPFLPEKAASTPAAADEDE